jgi:hypothetical protein
MIHQLIVPGIPVSLQTKSAARRAAWTEKVRAAARDAIAEADRHEFAHVAVVIIQFCFDWGEGDLDNIAKPILDGLAGPAYSDDQWVTQLTLRRTELGRLDALDLLDVPGMLLDAVQASYAKREDFVYVRVADEADHRRMPWST